MIFVLIFCYFSIAAGICAVLFLPPLRWRLLRWFERQRLHAKNRLTTTRKDLGHAAHQTHSTIQQGRLRIADFLIRHRYVTLGLICVLLIPPILAWVLSRYQEFEFTDEVRATNVHIASLLQGEQLVPPPPLPPEVFTTREVEQVRPLIRYASRNWDLLEEEFRQRLLLVFKLMRERHGYEMAIIEGYRSPERQAQLASMGDHVTRAGAYQSYHQFGLAADCAFYRDNKLVISEKDPWAMRGYQLYGEIAAEVGMTWGGNWKMMDLGHVELRRRGVLKRMGN